MEQITSWIEGFVAPLQTLGLAIGVLAVIVLGIILITSGQEGIAKGKRMAVGIISGIAVISFGTSIIASLQG